MLFNSLQFLLFFPIVVFIYFALAYRFRWIWLLGCSYFFYMCWNPSYAILIFISTAITYLSGLYLGKINNIKTSDENVRLKKICVGISFVINIGILVFFKYYNFLSENITYALSELGLVINNPSLDFLLPVGISFYTFQALGYTLDVYRGDIKPERHFGKYALFVSFFPQLVAGPIERSGNLLPQFSEKKEFNYDRLREGLFIMLSGFFKKIVIADRLAVLVNTVYNNPTEYDGYALILATVFFSFQIYCDFSAYSDIAIGAAKIIGYDLMTNFNKPYFSKSIAEFWGRWHISLSSWFKDYLYIPLGGNRVSQINIYRNILIVFIVSGLWHGASWNFIIWGALHGCLLILALLFKPLNKRIIEFFQIRRESYGFKFFNVIITYIIVCITWIFFRANSLPDAVYILKNSFNISSFNLKNIGLEPQDFRISIYLIILLVVVQFFQRKKNIKEMVFKENLMVRWSFYALMVLIIVFWGYYENEAAQFIYFQF